MNSNILLSICIPTFNRADLLKKSIDSIVNDPLFASNKVEIVVSDNASTDKTEDLLVNYSKKYNNFRYSKNLINNGFMNIFTVLNLARGEFFKVINDYTVFNKNTLETLIQIIESNIEKKPQIFFGHGFLKYNSEGYYSSFDHFLSMISYWCTYVGGYSVWKKDFDLVKEKNIHNMFPHVSLLFFLTYKSYYLINNTVLFTNQELKSKGGYNLFNVFAVQFFDLLISIKNSNSITESTFNKLKKDMLYYFFVLWYYNLVINKNRNVYFDKNDIKKNFRVYYTRFDYVKLCFLGHLYVFVIFKNRLINKLSKLIRKIKVKC